MARIPTEPEFSAHRADLLPESASKRLQTLVPPALDLLGDTLRNQHLPISQRLQAVELVIKLLEVQREI